MQNDIFTYLNFIRVLAEAMFGHRTCLLLTLNQTHKHQEVFPSNTLVSCSGERGIPHQLYRGGEKKEKKQFTRKNLVFVDRGK